MDYGLLQLIAAARHRQDLETLSRLTVQRLVARTEELEASTWTLIVPRPDREGWVHPDALDIQLTSRLTSAGVGWADVFVDFSVAHIMEGMEEYRTRTGRFCFSALGNIHNVAVAIESEYEGADLFFLVSEADDFRETLAQYRWGAPVFVSYIPMSHAEGILLAELERQTG